MKIDNDFNPTMQQNNLNNLPQSSDNSNNGTEDAHKDKIIISDEAREALLERTDDAISATELIEKVSSSYPKKDLKLKMDDIEIEATEPKLYTKIGNLVGNLLGGMIK